MLKRGLDRDPVRRFASMTALLNALERAQGRRWEAPAAVGLLSAALGVALVVSPVSFGFAPKPATALAPVVVADAEEYVPIVVAARDLEEGTVVTMEMLQQRTMPARFVTSSVVKPDAASYIVNQRILVPVQASRPETDGATSCWAAPPTATRIR